MQGMVKYGVLSLSICLAACGSDGASSSNGAATTGGKAGASAGGSTSGGAASTNAGSGGTAVGGQGGGQGGAITASNEFEACAAYTLAVCQRDVECGYFADPCDSEELAMNCPDQYFSDGSTRTVEGLVACAEEWRTHPCDQVLLGVPPDCVLPGTRAPGEACVFGSQCQTLVCGGTSLDADHPQCFTCLRNYGSDEDCTVGGAVCPIGQNCDQTSKRCAVPTTAPEPIDIPGLNEECGSYCADSLLCLAGFGELVGTCQPALPESGEACVYAPGYPEALCAQGLSCNDDDQCVALPAAGTLCSIDDGGTGHCAEGAYCAYAMQCATPPSAGQPCGNDQDGHALACAAGSYCKGPGGESTCTALPEAGEPCVRVYRVYESLSENVVSEIAATCAEGFACDCADAGCTAGTCKTELEVNEACGAANTKCTTGTSCIDGTCQRGSLFTDLCE